MRKHLGWVFLLILAVILLLTACEETPTETPPSAAQTGLLGGQPTRTVKPIVSFTPRFTATSIPSETPIPSTTPLPTATPIPPTVTATPTPTSTPTIAGVIQANENVNLRTGPGFDYDIAVSVPPGTDLGVLRLKTDERGYDWYEVAYTSDEGEVQRLWARTNLVDTDFEEIVTVLEPEANATPTNPASNLSPTPEPNRITILAYCREKGVRPPTPTTNDKVFIEWSWFVARTEYMDDHLANANYEVRLDGDLLDNWQAYATEMKQEVGVWIVYWYYPVGKLAAGEHEITYRLSWDEAISDGYQQFGPDTPTETNEGSCTFTVVEP